MECVRNLAGKAGIINIIGILNKARTETRHLPLYVGIENTTVIEYLAIA